MSAAVSPSRADLAKLAARGVFEGSRHERAVLPISLRGKVHHSPLADRLAEYAMPEPNSGCVFFLGHLQKNGYGRIRVGTRDVNVHRIAYELEYGPIPAGLVIDHLCRVKSCINPRHLEAVSSRVNILRGTSPSARNATKAACERGHRFTRETTKRKGGHRSCRVCEWALEQIRLARLQGKTLTFAEVEPAFWSRRSSWTDRQEQLAFSLIGRVRSSVVLAAVNESGPTRTKNALKSFAKKWGLSLAVRPAVVAP